MWRALLNSAAHLDSRNLYYERRRTLKSGGTGHLLGVDMLVKRRVGRFAVIDWYQREELGKRYALVTKGLRTGSGFGSSR